MRTSPVPRARPAPVRCALATLATLALLAGCASGSTPAAPLENTYWRLVALGGRPAVVTDNEREAHLRFGTDSGRVVGSTGCNRLSGQYTHTGGTLRFGPAITTKMACADQGANDQERDFLAALQAADRHAIAGDTLTLANASGPLARLVATAMRTDGAPASAATSAPASGSPSTGSPSTGSPSTGSPSTWTVTEQGLGPLRAGMTLRDASSALGGALAPRAGTDTSACTYLEWRGGPPGVRVMSEGGRIARVEVVDSGTIATAAGARIGDTEARVQSLYAGRVTVLPHKYTAGRYLTVTPAVSADSAYRIVFETDGQRVTRYRAGRRPQVEYVEGCG
ncbi:MAG: META domain-containing protein [Gemmatimonadaceae bacterium]